MGGGLDVDIDDAAEVVVELLNHSSCVAWSDAVCGKDPDIEGLISVLWLHTEECCDPVQSEH